MAGLLALPMLASFFSGAFAAVAKAAAWLLKNPLVLAFLVIAALSVAVVVEHGAAVKARTALAGLEAQEKAAGAAAARLETQRASASAAIGAADAKAQTIIRTVTRTITTEIPAHVTLATDARYPLPVGFVRLHDAGALGLDVSAVPDPAGRPDDAASPIAASVAVGVIVGNYGLCRETAGRLTDLQAWVTAMGAPPGR